MGDRRKKERRRGFPQPRARWVRTTEEMTERVCEWVQEYFTRLLSEPSWPTGQVEMMPPYMEERPDPEVMMRQRMERMFDDVRRINEEYIARQVLPQSLTMSAIPQPSDDDVWSMVDTWVVK